jgi:hypothetical protein
MLPGKTRLGARVPRPRSHLLRFCYRIASLYAPNAQHRSGIIAPLSASMQCTDNALEAKPSAAMNWMQRLRRACVFDINRCLRCGGQARVITIIKQLILIAFSHENYAFMLSGETRILEHRATGDARGAGARAPPGTMRY